MNSGNQMRTAWLINHSDRIVLYCFIPEIMNSYRVNQNQCQTVHRWVHSEFSENRILLDSYGQQV
jgi:uncharacterized circularly permuted ATP-grasp superfamily protein